MCTFIVKKEKQDENLSFRYNTFFAGHGISVGSETSGGIIDVFAHDNKILGPSFNGVRIKTCKTRGKRNLDCRSRKIFANIYTNNIFLKSEKAAETNSWEQVFLEHYF